MQFRWLAGLSDLMASRFRRDAATLPVQWCPACGNPLKVRSSRLECPRCGWWETDPGIGG